MLVSRIMLIIIELAYGYHNQSYYLAHNSIVRKHYIFIVFEKCGGNLIEIKNI